VTKRELIRTLNRCKADVEGNHWEQARGQLYLALGEVKERQDKEHAKNAPFNIRVKQHNDHYQVFMGGVPKTGDVDLESAKEVAVTLALRHHGQIVEAPWKEDAA